MDYVGREISVAGAALWFREAGPQGAPPLLFLHGAGGAESALPFLSGFVPARRVVVPDQPGFGRSALPPWLDNIHDAAYACLGFIEALDLHGVHLVGSSLGGWVALEVAVRDASRLASLTLIGACGVRPGDISTGDLFMWSPEERVRRLVADPALAEKILALPQSAEQADIALRNHFTTARLAWEPRFFDPHLEKWLHRIRVPAHVIWGDSDQLFPPAYGRKLAALIPGARFSVIPDCGHLPQVERPAELATLVAQLACADSDRAT